MTVQHISLKGKRLYTYIAGNSVEFKIDSIPRSDLFKALLEIESDLHDIHDIMIDLAGYVAPGEGEEASDNV